MKLRTSSPAAVRSTTAIAISEATSTWRQTRPPRPDVAPRSTSRRSTTRSARDPRSAGIRAAQQRARHRHQGGKGHDPSVEHGGVNPWNAAASQRDDEADRLGGQRESEQAAGASEHQALDEELPDELSATGAKRGADGDFLDARRRAREQHVRDVGAGNEQHQRRQRRTAPREATDVADDDVGQRCHGHVRFVPGNCRSRFAAIAAMRIRARSRDTPGAQSREDTQAVAVAARGARRERQRRPQLGASRPERRETGTRPASRRRR